MGRQERTYFGVASARAAFEGEIETISEQVRMRLSLLLFAIHTVFPTAPSPTTTTFTVGANHPSGRLQAFLRSPTCALEVSYAHSAELTIRAI
jgi:hypothetical protein